MVSRFIPRVGVYELEFAAAWRKITSVALLTQVEVPIMSEWSYFIDFVIPNTKIGIEVDGKHHKQPAQMRKDQRKQSILEDRGWTIFRVSNTEIEEGVSKAVASVLQRVSTLIPERQHTVEYPRTVYCAECGKPIVVKTARQRYCKQACQWAAWSRIHRRANIEYQT